jgi:murein DD-endopeptidase MepM/ murein hydrolase activator NlpD
MLVITFRRTWLILLAIVLSLTMFVTPGVSALPESDQHSLIYGSEWYDENTYEFATCGSAATGTGTGGATGTVPATFSLGPMNNATQRQINLMKALILDYALTPAQAAGIIGNFMRESSGTADSAAYLPPDVNQGDSKGAPPNSSSLGYGWAQWSGSRKTSFVRYLQSHKYLTPAGHATDAGDYAYLKSELNTGYKSTITQLKKQQTPQDAAESFERTYEAAGAPALAERQANAVKAFNAYQAANGGGSTTSPGSTSAQPGCASTGGAAIVGNVAFPLITTRAVMNQKNPGLFANNTTGKSGHPYTAYDILAPSGTPVVSFMDGTFIHQGEDKCGGTLLSIYNKESDMVVSYLHVIKDSKLATNATVKAGQRIGTVGSSADGCGTPHLHIDAAKGQVRPGCKREDCPAANAAKFVDIGPQLYQTYLKLP